MYQGALRDVSKKMYLLLTRHHIKERDAGSRIWAYNEEDFGRLPQFRQREQSVGAVCR